MKKQILASVLVSVLATSSVYALEEVEKSQIMIIVGKKNSFRKILKSLGLMMQKDGALIKVTI